MLDRPLTSYHIVLGATGLLLVLGLMMVLSASSVLSLRVNGNSQNSSRNQSLDCSPNYSNLADELAHGCDQSYIINSGTACPNSQRIRAPV